MVVINNFRKIDDLREQLPNIISSFAEYLLAAVRGETIRIKITKQALHTLQFKVCCVEDGDWFDVDFLPIIDVISELYFITRNNYRTYKITKLFNELPTTTCLNSDSEQNLKQNNPVVKKKEILPLFPFLRRINHKHTYTVFVFLNRSLFRLKRIKFIFKDFLFIATLMINKCERHTVIVDIFAISM